MPDPLSILMASDVDPVKVIGGAERMLNEHSRRLAARGHHVVVLTRREDPNRPEHEVMEGVHVYRHPLRQGNPVTFMRSAVREAGRMFGALARKLPFDVLIVHQPLAAAGVLQAPESAALPCLYTFLSPWAEEYRVRAERRASARGRTWLAPLSAGSRAVNSLLRQRMEKRCLDRAQRILVLSDFSASQLVQTHGISEGKVSLIPGGVDADRFRPAPDRAALRRELGLPPDRLILLTVRNLVPRMGLENLLHAMAPVCRRWPEALLVVGGMGPLAEPLRAQAHELGIAENVRFAGFIPEEQLPGYYAAADLFVLATRCLEGFGLVTVESLACGTPVLGTPVGGTQEILRGFDASLLLGGAAAEDLAAGILAQLPRVRGNEELRHRCRRHVEETYSWDVIIPRVEALLYEVAGRCASDQSSVVSHQ